MTGDEIREARERLRWTQRQLGQAVGVGWRTISNWERGETVPMNSMGRLRQVLGADEENPAPLGAWSEVDLLAELTRRALERERASRAG